MGQGRRKTNRAVEGRWASQSRAAGDEKEQGSGERGQSKKAGRWVRGTGKGLWLELAFAALETSLLMSLLPGQEPEIDQSLAQKWGTRQHGRDQQ